MEADGATVASLTAAFSSPSDSFVFLVCTVRLAVRNVVLLLYRPNER
jgi:hypothetical protein